MILLSDQLKDDRLGGIAFARSLLDDAGITAALAKFFTAFVVLGSQFAEDLFNQRMVDILGARAIIAAGFPVIALTACNRKDTPSCGDVQQVCWARRL